MEDSAERRERLRAVRAEAAAPWPVPAATSPTPPAMSLVNPLLSPVAPPPEGDASHGRFDYYTNPVSAFSGSKRSNPGFSSSLLSSSSGGGPSNYQTTATVASAHQFQVNRSPDQRPHLHSSQSSSWGSPGGPSNYQTTTTVASARQFQVNRSPDQRPHLHSSQIGSWGSPGGPSNYQATATLASAHQFQVDRSPDQRPHLHSSQSGSWGSPGQFGRPFSGFRGTPVRGHDFWYQSGGSPGQGYPMNPPGGGYCSPSLGRGGSPMSYSGRGYPGRGSPYSSSARGGRGGRYGSNPSPRWSGVRGQCSASSVRVEGEGLYVKSMVKDPWRKLKPIVGNILVPKAGWGSRLPESSTAKKAKVLEDRSKLKSDVSLAEYLARSFEEAANEAPG